MLVFWREEPAEDAPKPRHNETVNVPIGGTRDGPKGIKDFMERERAAWKWDFLDSVWRRIQPWEIYPGMTLMLDANQGGYTSETGWDTSSKEPVTVIEEDGEPEDGQGSEPTNTRKKWVTLSRHSRNVEREAATILGEMAEESIESEVREAVALAALYHDAGKAYPAFQSMLRHGREDAPTEDVQLAKG